jgi:hypothetical protein
MHPVPVAIDELFQGALDYDPLPQFLVLGPRPHGPFPYVRDPALDVVHVDSDFDAAFMQLERPDDPQMKKWDWEAEGRLFYVAMTRAKSAVELPPGAMSYFGVQNSHTERFGKPYVAERPAMAMRAAARTPRTFSSSTRPAPVVPTSPPAPSQPEPSQSPGPLARFLRSIFK